MRDVVTQLVGLYDPNAAPEERELCREAASEIKTLRRDRDLLVLLVKMAWRAFQSGDQPGDSWMAAADAVVREHK